MLNQLDKKKVCFGLVMMFAVSLFLPYGVRADEEKAKSLLKQSNIKV